VSKHWKPEDHIVRAQARAVRKSWPAGATAGLLLIAAACVGVSVVLYQVAGPRDVFEKE
jgi:hypothetical protein